MDVFFLIVLLAGLYATSNNRILFIASLILGGSALTANSLRYFMESSLLKLISISSYGLFFSVLGITMLLCVLKDEKVTTNTISGALCFYLLLGVIWASLFTAMETLQPGSFLFEGESMSLRSDNLYGDFIYYSFVTMTTLGYGDIAPSSHPARALSSLEAVMGQLYIAVLIARLVGLHIVHAKK